MKPLIALWALTFISLLSIWNLIEQIKKCKTKKQKSDVVTYALGIVLVIIVCILAWIL